MSGGSYNYLDATVSDGLFGEAIDRTHLGEMADRLAGLPWASKATRDVRSIVERARALDDELKQLSDVFHAVEWWDSCDWGEDEVRAVLATYEAGE